MDARLSTTRLFQNGLTVVGNGRVSLLPGGALPSVIASLELVGGGTLDLNESALIVDYSGPSPLPAIRNSIISGRGGVGIGNGTWSGTGITSSTVSALNIVAPESHAIGYADNVMLPLGPYTHFHGLPVDNTAILLAPTVTADANLDGLVSDDEVTIVGAFYQPGALNPHWQFGDFDFNGSVDDDDVTLLGAFYRSTSLVMPVPPSSVDRWEEAFSKIAVQENGFPIPSRRNAESSAAYFGEVGRERSGAPDVPAGSFRIALAEDELLLDMLARTIATESAGSRMPGLANDRAASPRGRWQFDPLWSDSLWSPHA
jgi:hypothetical protein